MTEDLEREAEPTDRDPIIAVFLSGESFFKSAQYLRKALDNKDLQLRFQMPVYYLYSHALELTLKAFLRTKGLSSGKMRSREFGHKLQALWAACLKNGLRLHPVKEALVAEIVELLDSSATDFEFRYVKVGFKTLPTLDGLEAAVADLIESVRPLCGATVGGQIPPRG
ncbi:hypothetical protein [Bradyrhizobium sp. NFR13]|uniref:hypothetical protein n=1 Tax=Bradyrhizobium sp. NFR13 TaxID=1566285 RepID=UPI000B856D5F|nr:hypothetical protein [Bradyrhizobium sp. NFR13]